MYFQELGTGDPYSMLGTAKKGAVHNFLFMYCDKNGSFFLAVCSIESAVHNYFVSSVFEKLCTDMLTHAYLLTNQQKCTASSV